MKKLPKGARLSKGKYVQIRIMHRGSYYHEHIGLDCDLAREIASIRIAEIRKDILLGTFGMKKELPTKKFKDAVWVWFKFWSAERDPNGELEHSERATKEYKRVITTTLLPAFGQFDVDAIKPRMIQDWREKLMTSGPSGTTANRYQTTLSSFFNGTKRLIDLEKIDAFKLPHNANGVYENPCGSVEKAPNVKRKRLLTRYEASKLKNAFINILNDADGWIICEYALLSVLSLSDLKKLELGQEIDINREKTGVGVHIPLVVTHKLNWLNWRKRWEAAREKAGLTDLQFRDLRKSGINWLLGRHDIKLISQYAAHADQKTTESIYALRQSDKLAPLATDLLEQIKSLEAKE
jgi:integrase